MENLNNVLNSFESLVLIKVENQDDLFQSTFIYQSGSFKKLGLKDYKNFNELIKSIYRSAPICEGIGYYEYCHQIKESILRSMDEGIKSSFILPLRIDGTEGPTLYFLMNINKHEDHLNVLFISFEEDSKYYNIEDFSSGTFKDGLTGLFNYRTFVSHVSENKRRGYLCLFDLNKFKYINDTFGHETGDEVLIHVAKYLISISSLNEVFYRRGGDEFVILVFEQDLDYVLKLVNQIEQDINSIPGSLNKSFIASAAFGILELKGNEEALPYELQSKLIDLAMYQAKKSHKLYHFINHEDALNIINSGDLDERIASIEASLNR